MLILTSDCIQGGYCLHSLLPELLLFQGFCSSPLLQVFAGLKTLMPAWLLQYRHSALPGSAVSFPQLLLQAPEMAFL